MPAVSGSNIILYRYDPDIEEDVPFACGLECTFTSESDVKEITSQSSAWYREFLYGINQWQISASGITILNDQYNYLYLFNAQKTREILTVKFVVDNGGILGLTIISGTALLNSYELTGTYNEASTYRVSLQGSGEPSVAGTVITPGGTTIIAGTTMQVFQYTASEGQTSIIFPGTVGLDALYASRGGQTMQPIQYVGSPQEPNGCTWVTAEGKLNLATPSVEGELFLILAQ